MGNYLKIKRNYNLALEAIKMLMLKMPGGFNIAKFSSNSYCKYKVTPITLHSWLSSSRKTNSGILGNILYAWENIFGRLTDKQAETILNYKEYITHALAGSACLNCLYYWKNECNIPDIAKLVICTPKYIIHPSLIVRLGEYKRRSIKL